MKYLKLIRAFGCAGLLLFGFPALSEEMVRLSYEAELEVGVELASHSDENEDARSKAFVSSVIEFELSLSNQLTGFAELSLESVLSSEDGRRLTSTDFETEQLGLSYKLGRVTLSFGKISPRFGSAKDTAPGYFGSNFAEDYELESSRGLMASIILGESSLAASAFAGFRAVEQGLSQENGEISGGLNSFALQYDIYRDRMTYHLGIRTISQGEEGTSVEQGLALGLTADTLPKLTLMAEVAAFRNWEGSSDNAIFATVGARFTRGPANYNGAYSRRRTNGGQTDELVSVGIDWEIDSVTMLNVGYAQETTGRNKSSTFALAITRQLGN